MFAVVGSSILYHRHADEYVLPDSCQDRAYLHVQDLFASRIFNASDAYVFDYWFHN